MWCCRTWRPSELRGTYRVCTMKWVHSYSNPAPQALTFATTRWTQCCGVPILVGTRKTHDPRATKKLSTGKIHSPQAKYAVVAVSAVGEDPSSSQKAREESTIMPATRVGPSAVQERDVESTLVHALAATTRSWSEATAVQQVEYCVGQEESQVNVVLGK